MKILIVSDWMGLMHAQAYYDSFSELGHEVYKFSWKEYFCSHTSDLSVLNNSLFNRVQNKFIIGPKIYKINNDLMSLCNSIKPDLIFIYRGTHIFPRTIRSIKNNLTCKVFGFHNDDPFSKFLPKYMWRYFWQSLKEYDHIFAYRPKNIQDYNDHGFDNVSILRSSYIKKYNYQNLNCSYENSHDVVFIGHFEDDGRDALLKKILESGVNLKIFGPEWHKSKLYKYFVSRVGEIRPLLHDYNTTLSCSKIALVFLSKINNDSYTRRCFEIPATKTMMISEYSDDMATNLFIEGESAEYFRSDKELINKIKFYLLHKQERDLMADNAWSALLKGRHEIHNRAEEIITIFNSIKN
jgi:spore maturation protein CgeB